MPAATSRPADQLPAAATAADYDADRQGPARSHLRRVVRQPPQRPPQRPRPEFRRTRREPLRIISPANNATFLLDPEIPSGSDKLRPVTNLPGTARWQSDTLRIEPASPEPIIHLTAGTHTLTATDPATGVTHTLTLRVKSLCSRLENPRRFPTENQLRPFEDISNLPP